MSEQDIRVWLVNWFEERNPETEIPVDKNYYSEGLLDSFGIIEMIAAIEEEYAIVFEDDDFTREEFLTIEGLVGLIRKRQVVDI